MIKPSVFDVTEIPVQKIFRNFADLLDNNALVKEMWAKDAGSVELLKVIKALKSYAIGTVGANITKDPMEFV